MPVQRTLLGRPVRVRTPPKRFVIFGGFFAFLTVLYLVTSSTRPHIPNFSDLKDLKPAAFGAVDKIKHSGFPKLWNPTAPQRYMPRDQEGNTGKGMKWLQHTDWLNPFSSRTSWDEERPVLNPPIPRAPIYTYYERSSTKSKAVADAENELILTWRRAWWAKGFRPIVLGPAEARKHEYYEAAHAANLQPDLVKDIDRWLAWSHMGGGILSEWLLVPFDWYDPLEPIMGILRRGEYHNITTWNPYGRALVAANPGNLTEALNVMFEDIDSLGAAEGIMSALRPAEIANAGKTRVVGYYDFMTVASKYKPVLDKMKEDEAAGKRDLNVLINSHLHQNFEFSYPEGVAIITPSTANMGYMMKRARKLVHLLTTCPESPLPGSCRPQVDHCDPCNPSRVLKTRNAHSFSAATSRFQVGVIPHPYTFNSLRYLKDSLNTSFVRRKTSRDYFLESTTEALGGDRLAGQQRVPHFKAGLAGPSNQYACLWQLAEEPEMSVRNVEWKVGFSLPTYNPTEKELLDPIDQAEAEFIAPGERPLTQANIERERELLTKAIAVVQGRGKSAENDKSLDMLEAWNQADAEAWRFAKAYSIRFEMERDYWEYTERNFASVDPAGEEGSSHSLGWHTH